VELLDGVEMALQRLVDAVGQHGHPIVGALALADGDLVHGKIDVLDPQPQALHQPQARAIEQTGHEPRRCGEVLQDPFDFLTGQDHGQFLRLFRPDDVIEPGDLLVQDLLI
jgi:hypothetical protein